MDGEVEYSCISPNGDSILCVSDEPTAALQLLLEEEVDRCRRERALGLLTGIKEFSRPGQRYEVQVSDKAYYLQRAEVRESPYSNSEINSGEWKEDAEMVYRLEWSEDHILQFAALGINSRLSVSDSIRKHFCKVIR